MVALELLLCLGILITIVIWGVAFRRHCRKMIELYLSIDELLIPFYQETLRHELHKNNYGEALRSLTKTLLAYKTQIAISKTCYFHRFVERSNTFSQSFQHDLQQHGFDLETKLLVQQNKSIALVKHLRLWLMELEKSQHISIGENFNWKGPAPTEQSWRGIKLRPEARVLFIRMMLLHVQFLQVLWCWHFSLRNKDEEIKAAQFLIKVLSAHYACAKLLGLKQLLPKYDADYEYLVQYCKENPIDCDLIRSGIDRSLDPSWSDFDTSFIWEGEVASNTANSKLVGDSMLSEQDSSNSLSEQESIDVKSNPSLFVFEHEKERLPFALHIQDQPKSFDNPQSIEVVIEQQAEQKHYSDNKDEMSACLQEKLNQSQKSEELSISLQVNSPLSRASSSLA